MCRRNLSTEGQSTISAQRRSNYACQPRSQEQFVALVTADQPSAPPYLVYNATLNRRERDHRGLTVTIPLLDDAAIAAELVAGAVVLDTRSPADFAAGHLTGSINVGADGRLGETAGWCWTPSSASCCSARWDGRDVVSIDDEWERAARPGGGAPVRGRCGAAARRP